MTRELSTPLLSAKADSSATTLNYHFAPMHEGFLKGLEQPEYVHVLINPLPVYGLALGLVALTIALALRSREARICAFILILIAATSAWPVIYYGRGIRPRESNVR